MQEKHPTYSHPPHSIYSLIRIHMIGSLVLLNLLEFYRMGCVQAAVADGC
jgi:hypothetical protein